MRRREAAADTAFANVLREAVEAVEKAGYPFLVLGGLASSLVGRPRLILADEPDSCLGDSGFGFRSLLLPLSETGGGR